jgi:hypothetical protein
LEKKALLCCFTGNDDDTTFLNLFSPFTAYREHLSENIIRIFLKNAVPGSKKRFSVARNAHEAEIWYEITYCFQAGTNYFTVKAGQKIREIAFQEDKTLISPTQFKEVCVKVFKSAVAAVLLASVCSFAGIELAIGGGECLSNKTMTKDYKLQDGVDNNMRFGYSFGINARYALDEHMGLVAGVSYETRGLIIDYGGITDAKNANYLQIPILFSYKVIPDVAINIGPEAGLFLGGKDIFTVYGQETKDDLKDINKLDLGMSAQVNIYSASNWIVVGISYYYGLLNTDSADHNPAYKGSETNNSIKVTVSVLISKLLGM